VLAAAAVLALQAVLLGLEAVALDLVDIPQAHIQLP
jgi:hypothetical protein